MKLIGPFTQLIPLEGLPLKGALGDEQLRISQDAGLLVRDGHIHRVGPFEELAAEARSEGYEIYRMEQPVVALPGFIDAHTHLCFAGSRARDYSLRNAGKTYLEIAEAGGGIWDTVTHTRKATPKELTKGIVDRARRHLKNGITTIEVKSGYGLSVSEELKMLRAIHEARETLPVDLIPTCLAAHMGPKDFPGTNSEYLEMLTEELLPRLKKEQLCSRIDGFVEQSAFTPAEITPYFQKAKTLGFDLTVHADQFTTGGSEVAVACGARSADHLEASTAAEIQLLAKSEVIATALPGASLGLGCDFAPARKLLDSGAALAIASDWNPGSAPMGDLLTQAALLGAFEKLTAAEVFAGITFRAAAALGLQDRGRLIPGMRADLVLFPGEDYREILYHQGSLKPNFVWKNGNRMYEEPNY